MVRRSASDGAALAEELSAAKKNEVSWDPWAGKELPAAQKNELSWAVERAKTAEKDRITAELKAVTDQLEATTQLIKALALERGAALERAKLAEEERDVLREQLVAKDRELDAANRRGDLAEEDLAATLRDLEASAPSALRVVRPSGPRATANAKATAKAKAKGKATEYQYGRPVDYCVASQRWRDARGRYCREPSPARRAKSD